MSNKSKNSSDYNVIDVMHIIKTIWHKAWIVVLSGVIAAAIGFSIAAFAITPKYSSSIMLYVNNSSISLNGKSFSISSSEISAAQSLLKTYVVILNNRTTLEKIIKKADLDYSTKELSNMIEASSVNDTEVMKVTVTCENPNEAAKIVNCIAEVLPVRISEIIDGASMEVVDSGVPNTQRVSPSISRFTEIGLVLGLLISIIALTIAALMDNTIHNEEYILENYDYPILAKIPDLFSSNSKEYGYYSSHRRMKMEEND